MKPPRTGQVQLPELLFGMSWEDPESDRRALALQPNHKVVTITSGGCNTLSLLLDDPQRIYSIDINPCQSHLLKLKCVAIRTLGHDDLRAFLGLTPSNQRLELFECIAPNLSKPALQYWRSHLQAIRRGVVYQGRYESFLSYFRRLVRILQGTGRIEKLFECRSIEEQRDYFDKVWNTRRWRMLFRLAFNKRVLARRGLQADYFRFDDGTSSFADSFFQRSKRAFREISVKCNYFLAQYLLGRYLTEEAVPAYLRKDNLPVIRERLDRIEIVTADAKSWLATRGDQSIDGFSLSNICELMSVEETNLLFDQVARTARPQAGICFRNLIIPREIPQGLNEKIQLQAEASRQLLERDRSFVYSRVRAYVAY